MNIVGLSYDFHDGAACLVRDGELVSMAAEERYTLHKHDSSYPTLALAAQLREHGLALDAVDEVVFYEQPGPKYSRVLTNGFARFPRGLRDFVSANRSWLRDKLWTRAALSSRFGIPPSRIHLAAHHHSHVAQAFYASPFDEAAVLVLDGIGEWDCTTLAYASREASREARPDAGGGLRILEQYEYPHSIGLVYAAFTAYLGFKPNSGEASTMALAAFGKPRFAEAMRRVLRSEPDGSYAIDVSHFNFDGDAATLFSAPLIDAFGPPRDFRVPYAFDSLADGDQQVPDDDQRCADIAASLQQVLAEVLLGLASRLTRLTGSRNLCFAGGVALNCLANTELIERSAFDHFFVPPDPGDGGAAFGAAMLRAAQHGPVQPIRHPYLGSAHAPRDLGPLIEADPGFSFLLGHQALGDRQAAGIGSTRHDDEDSLLDDVSQALADGAIVAWVQGRFEVGPRALGNRSLLVHPGKLDTVRRMSRTVKLHTHFRPYALSIAAEQAAQVLDTRRTGEPVLKWMQTIWPVREAYRTRLRGAIHVDGTTRPQVCSRDDNPRYWALLNRFGQHSGVAALLNTSLNERSLPMVGHPRMALAMFARTGIDMLVIDDLVLRKRY
jgi:carbamoyltransferase